MYNPNHITLTKQITNPEAPSIPATVEYPSETSTIPAKRVLIRAYAACDQADRTPKQVEALYRKRSAIETSFRTFREAHAKTSTQDPTVRLLFVLVGFLLRNLWLVIRWGVLAQPRRGGRELPTWFRFEVFREWIAHDLDEDLDRRWEAPTNGVGIPKTYRQLAAG